MNTIERTFPQHQGLFHGGIGNSAGHIWINPFQICTVEFKECPWSFSSVVPSQGNTIGICIQKIQHSECVVRRHQLYGLERPQVQRKHDRLWQDVTFVVLPYVSLVLVEKSYIQQRPPVLEFFHRNFDSHSLVEYLHSRTWSRTDPQRFGNGRLPVEGREYLHAFRSSHQNINVVVPWQNVVMLVRTEKGAAYEEVREVLRVANLDEDGEQLSQGSSLARGHQRFCVSPDHEVHMNRSCLAIAELVLDLLEIGRGLV